MAKQVQDAQVELHEKGTLLVKQLGESRAKETRVGNRVAHLEAKALDWRAQMAQATKIINSQANEVALLTKQLADTQAKEALLVKREDRLRADSLCDLSRQDLGGLEADLKARMADLTGALDRVAREKERLAERALDREREEKTCVICMDGPKTTLLLPCRHLCLCSACALRPEIKECPVCRTKITDSMAVFA
jgi:hypothetical protein